jgi:hypothetical protein
MRSAPLLVWFCLLAVAGCDITISGGGAGTGPGTGRGGTAIPTSPTPAPAPTPGQPIPTPAPVGFRTPDPSPGSFLPLPPYGIQVLNTVTIDPALHCLDYVFIDAVVDALRLRDTRWGYMCRDCRLYDGLDGQDRIPRNRGPGGRRRARLVDRGHHRIGL